MLCYVGRNPHPGTLCLLRLLLLCSSLLWCTGLLLLCCLIDDTCAHPQAAFDLTLPDSQLRANDTNPAIVFTFCSPNLSHANRYGSARYDLYLSVLAAYLSKHQVVMSLPKECAV